MAGKSFKIDKELANYIVTVLVVSIIAIYVVFFMPSKNLVKPSSSIDTVEGEAPVAIINASGGVMVSGEDILLVESGKSIVFDASNSYDPDGKILSYEWSFGDESTEEGKIVSHTFYIDQDSFSKYGSVTYSVILRVYDNSLPDGRMGDDILLVTVVPSKLYLAEGTLLVNAPDNGEEKVKLPLFGDGVELVYNLSNPFFMPTSSCNVTLHIIKPRLSLLTKVVVSYYDGDGNDITITEINSNKLFGFWKERVISAKGIMQDTGGGIAGLKIKMFGISIRGISLIYGGDSPSLIEFTLG